MKYEIHLEKFPQIFTPVRDFSCFNNSNTANVTSPEIPYTIRLFLLRKPRYLASVRNDIENSIYVIEEMTSIFIYLSLEHGYRPWLFRNCLFLVVKGSTVYLWDSR